MFFKNMKFTTKLHLPAENFQIANFRDGRWGVIGLIYVYSKVFLIFLFYFL